MFNTNEKIKIRVNNETKIATFIKMEQDGPQKPVFVHIEVDGKKIALEIGKLFQIMTD